MRRVWPLAALGVGAYLVFLLVTLPAGIVLARLQPLGIYAAGVSGTAWRGQAQVLQVGEMPLGKVDWDLHILPLFTARLRADVKLARDDGFARFRVTVRPGGDLDFRDLTASLPIAALPANVVRGQWTGTVNLKFAELAVEDGWPVHAAGTLTVVDLASPARRIENMGSYNVSFSPEAGGDARNGGVLTGALSDLGGPLEIAGKLELRPDRSYLIDGLIAVRADAPRQVADVVQFLGPPDAQGRRPFSLEGTM